MGMKGPLQIAFYGKGGIGKSTVSSNIAAAMSEMGKKVMQMGCDPKADCTRNLRGDQDIPTILDVMREKGGDKLELTEMGRGKSIDLDEVVFTGFHGVLCVEAGGPEPAVGCAGRGIKVAVELLNRLGVYKSGLDVVIYDVLGDVVCGGFGMPLRQGLANDVYVVTSADYLAIYAANNICKGIQRYAGRGGSALGGIIYNVRGSLDDLGLVEEFAAKIGSKVIGTIPSDPMIQESELYGQTVIEHAPDSPAADRFRILARSILENGSTAVPKPLSRENLAIMAQKIREENRKNAKSGSRLHE
jgi:nitrogenase iron protein NifH